MPILDLLTHFRHRWPKNARNVADEYRDVATKKFFLTDLMLRCGVMSAPPPGLSTFDAGVAEGRRQIGVEILRACNEDPTRLYAIVEKTEIEFANQRQRRD